MTTNKINHKVIKPSDLGFTEEASRLDVSGASLCVRVLRQNWRQGTLGCKDRGEVAFSNVKPWKQKGTGRARAGTKRSPLWRKGGVIFGPQERSRTLQVPRKLRAGVLRSMMHGFLSNDRVISLEWESAADTPKTSQAYKALKDAGLVGKKITLFVAADDIFTQASFANIPTVQIIIFDACNVYDLATTEYIVYLQKDAEHINKMVNQWL